MRKSIFMALAVMLLHLPGLPQSDTEKEFMAGIDEIQTLVKKERWIPALKKLNTLLEEHEKKGYVISNRSVVEEILKVCVFNKDYKPPKLKTLFSGELTSYKASSGEVTFKYNPKNMKDFRDEKGGTPRSIMNMVTFHPVVFSDSYAVEVIGKDLPVISEGPTEVIDGRDPKKRYTKEGSENCPQVHVCCQDGNKYVVRIGLPMCIDYVKGGDKRQRWDGEFHPVYNRPKYCIKVAVTKSKISAYMNGKRSISIKKAEKKKGPFREKLGIGFFPFTEVVIKGKVNKEWMQEFMDAEAQKAFAEFEKSFDPKSHLPDWL